ncbi:MAG: sulfatase [Elusimicrobiota bacterium]|nr:sulfatase [Elusimicrobiota bacterium]
MTRLLLAAACLMAAPGVRGAEPARRPARVILVAVDTLRADRLGCYGRAASATPALDGLAAEGVLFERAVSQASWTLPSFASLFTAKDTRGHGLLAPDGRLRDGERSFVADLSSAGWRAAAFADGPFFDRRYGFDRGFERYEVAYGMPVEAVTPAALAWLESRRAAPAFLFLHTMNAHAPYHSPPPYAHRSDPGYDGLVDHVVIDHRFLALYNREPAGDEDARYARLVDAVRADPRARAHIASHYDDGVARVDGALGGFFDELRRRGLYDDALIVVLSDHGEELGERGKFRHNGAVSDAVTRVPLIVKLPGGREAGRRVSAQVRLMDAGPTVLALAGVRASAGGGGVDLSPLLEGRPAPGLPPTAFTASDSPRGRHSLFSASSGRWKLVRGGGEVDAFYDLEADPGETRDASKERPVERARLERELDEWSREKPRGASPAPLESRLEEALRAAGYRP